MGMIRRDKGKVRIVHDEDVKLGLKDNPNFYFEVKEEEALELVKALLADNYIFIVTLLKEKGFKSIKNLLEE